VAVVDLVLLSGSRSGACFGIPDVPIVVGRSPEANVHVDDPWISNMHALFEWRGRELWVVDLGSRNGTFVDDQRITEARVKPGMALAFGQTRLELRSRTGAPAPAGEHLRKPVRRHAVVVTVPHQTRLGRPAAADPGRRPTPAPERTQTAAVPASSGRRGHR
jgi:predicted component of type VI protein secretion system